MHFLAHWWAFLQHVTLTTYTTMGMPSNLSLFKKNFSSFWALAHCQWASGDILSLLEIFFLIFKLWGRVRTNLGFWEYLGLVQNEFAKPGEVSKGWRGHWMLQEKGVKPRHLISDVICNQQNQTKKRKARERRKVLGLLPSALWVACRSCTCSCTALFLPSLPSRPHHSHLWWSGCASPASLTRKPCPSQHGFSKSSNDRLG